MARFFIMRIRKENFKKWPFYRNSVLIKRYPGAAVTVTINSVEYAINGIATAAGFPPIPDEEWIDNPEIPGTKISISEIIQWGINNA